MEKYHFPIAMNWQLFQPYFVDFVNIRVIGRQRVELQFHVQPGCGLVRCLNLGKPVQVSIHFLTSFQLTIGSGSWLGGPARDSSVGSWTGSDS